MYLCIAKSQKRMSSILHSDMCQFIEGKGTTSVVSPKDAVASHRLCPFSISDIKTPYVCIRGTRGIGKTYELLRVGHEIATQLPLEKVLYVNLNHFYFAHNSLFDFANEAWSNGVKVLLLDQVFKYPNWCIDLEKCHMAFPELRVIFTASSVMTLEDDYPSIGELITIYDLYGFSFREYLNCRYHQEFSPITIKDLLSRSEAHCKSIATKVDILGAFEDYLRCGYYPPCTDDAHFRELLVKNMNMLLEVDLIYIRQVAPTYLCKLRQLLYLVGIQQNDFTNVSALSNDISVSRATVMNYLKYLSDARLIRLVYKEGEDFPRKPGKIYLNDTNELSYISGDGPSTSQVNRTFLLSALQDAGLTVNLSETRGVDFLVDHKYPLRYFGKGDKRRPTSPETIHILSDILKPQNGNIPLWLFGFLY